MARYRRFLLPGALTILALLSWEGSVNRLVGFDVAIIAWAIGLALIGWQTVQDVIRTRRIVAGVLVTIAMAATAYVEQFLAGAVVAIMMLTGEALEDLTLARTRNAIRGLLDLAPPVARVRHDDHFHTVPVEQVKVGDIVLVRAGERIPVDGEIISGSSAIDQSSITGESLPVDRQPGDVVFAGTTNLSGPIELRATAVGRDTTLGKIIDIVRQAQAKKGPAQKVADRFAGWFTPLISAITVVVYLLTGDLLRAASVLVIACPCALVLATPTAVVAAVGNAARRGALIKGGLTLELAGTVDAVVLDKTGTLTRGKPRVAEIVPFAGRSQRDVLALAASVESLSNHPLARAVVSAAEEEGVAVAQAVNTSEQPGLGMVGELDGRRVLVGNRRLLEQHGLSLGPDHAAALESVNSRGLTGVWVADHVGVAGLIAIGDTVRENAPELVKELKSLGIREIILLTGDSQPAARHVAGQLGIDRVIAEVLPHDKAEVVRSLQAEGRTVAMVGDGVNDAPALAVADVGIAMGAAGTDVAIESADLALLGDDLSAIPPVLRLSRRARRVIQQNIVVFAFLVNAVGIVLAAMGVLSPIGAAVVHNLASVAVVVNSARLLNVRWPGMKGAGVPSTAAASHH